MGAIKSTEIFFVYSNEKKKNIFVCMGFMYGMVLFLYVVLYAWGFRIVSIPIDTLVRTVPQYATKYSSRNTSKTRQRAIVFSSSYGIRFFDHLWSLPFHKKPVRGDAVLVTYRPRKDSKKNVFFHKNLWEKIRSVASLMTFNIIKPSTKYSVMRVVATEYERVLFSGAEIYEQDTARVIISNQRILPYVNADSVVQVPHGEVFLTSDIPYGLDSRYHGTYSVVDIVGKVKFFVGPVWGSIASEK